MRFVMVCSEGHMADVPWHRWTHSRAETPDQKQCEGGPLFFRVLPNAGGGLGSLVVQCGVPRCRASRSLAGITAKGAMAQIGLKCSGLQPWQFPRAELGHDVVPEVVQRGGSNVRFSRTESALDIPPESKYSEFSAVALLVTSSDYFRALRSSPTGPLAAQLIAAISETTSVPEADVRAVLEHELHGTAGSVDDDVEDLMGAEWLAFTSTSTEIDSRDTFVTRHVTLAQDGSSEPATDAMRPLVEMFDKVVLATKLREVRALVGFSRLEPGNTEVRPDLGHGLDWLPALEVYGEGIFLSLRESAVRAWERGPAAKRMSIVADRRSASHLAYRLPPATPRFMLLHTLAHLLIRQLAFDAGYSSASLRERIYARAADGSDEAQAGLLIYTGAGDAEGTLGGLVRLGEPERLRPSLLATLQRALWCSNDPICRESPGQGVDSLNRAACHACALISETSCVHSNALLDRALVVGSAEAGTSFFETPLRLALDRAAVSVGA
jgi:MrfA Zn-binding domain